MSLECSNCDHATVESVGFNVSLWICSFKSYIHFIPLRRRRPLGRPFLRKTRRLLVSGGGTDGILILEFDGGMRLGHGVLLVREGLQLWWRWWRWWWEGWTTCGIRIINFGVIG